MEALLKRVDGLEQRLRVQKKAEPGTPTSENGHDPTNEEWPTNGSATNATAGDGKEQSPGVDTARADQDHGEAAISSPTTMRLVLPTATYRKHFERLTRLSQSATRPPVFRRRRSLTLTSPAFTQNRSIFSTSLRSGKGCSLTRSQTTWFTPSMLSLRGTWLAKRKIRFIWLTTPRYTPHPSGYEAGVKLSEGYAAQARNEIDTDEPSVDALQALLLLVTAFTAAGKGKKAYMLLSRISPVACSYDLLTWTAASAVGMTVALELHREMDAQARVMPVEREMRRRLFWTCYLLDRFMACGSKRPSLIGDKTILLRLPCWSPNPGSPPIEGEFFQSGSNLQCLQGSGKKSQGSNAMLVDISRILGTTNRYLAAGGVKGDSHFPWHSLSNLSKIRQELDVWASGMEDVFSSLDTLFGQADSTILVLGKLIYHLIHCLIYRPFLPIDLAELAGPGQHQSWQIEATNMCFLHANAIAELVELGRQAATIEWPAFVGYCICTAGTVHIHGAHYSKNASGGEMNVFSSSAEFLSRAMQQLSELRYAWASVQHQRETLQGIYNAHSELVKSLENNPMRYSPVFHLEDFFDRYSNIGGPGGQTFSFDAANLSLSDVIVDFIPDAYAGNDFYAPRADETTAEPERPNLKRKNTGPSGRKRPDLKSLPPPTSSLNPPPTPGLPTASHPNHSDLSTTSLLLQPSPGMLHTPTSLPPQHELHAHHQNMNGLQGSMNETAANDAAVAAAAAAGFAIPPPPHRALTGHPMPDLSNTPFSPQYGYAQLHSSLLGSHGHSMQAQSPYDPMFGGMPTNPFSSPAPWHADEGGNSSRPPVVSSPGDRSHNGSTGTGSVEEKDPFLSLLEQLAENESVRGQGNELDFFLAGGSNAV